jgi:hypothetical protein
VTEDVSPVAGSPSPPPRPHRHSRRRPFVALRRAFGYLLLGLAAAVVALGIVQLLA